MSTEILESLDRMHERLGRIEGKQGEHTASLDEHMRRSIAAEKAIECLSARVKPLESAALGWAKVGQILVGSAGFVGAYGAIVKWLT